MQPIPLLVYYVYTYVYLCGCKYDIHSSWEKSASCLKRHLTCSQLALFAGARSHTHEYWNTPFDPRRCNIYSPPLACYVTFRVTNIIAGQSIASWTSSGMFQGQSFLVGESNALNCLNGN